MSHESPKSPSVQQTCLYWLRMKYVESSLVSGKHIVHRAQFHWTYSLVTWLWPIIPSSRLGPDLQARVDRSEN